MHTDTSHSSMSTRCAQEFENDDVLDDVGLELERFQNDAVLKAVLAQGVDLRQYSHEIETELKATESQVRLPTLSCVMRHFTDITDACVPFTRTTVRVRVCAPIARCGRAQRRAGRVR